MRYMIVSFLQKSEKSQNIHFKLKPKKIIQNFMLITCIFCNTILLYSKRHTAKYRQSRKGAFYAFYINCGSRCFSGCNL